jgi:hypothetical protein
LFHSFSLSPKEILVAILPEAAGNVKKSLVLVPFYLFAQTSKNATLLA